MGVRPCQCNHESCAFCKETPGPAYVLVKRNGVELEVCTKCRLSGDEIVRYTIDASTPMNPFIEWDAEGITLEMMCGLGDHIDSMVH